MQAQDTYTSQQPGPQMQYRGCGCIQPLQRCESYVLQQQVGEHKLRIAIIGAGISGLYAGHLLHKDHEITLFEAADYIGGHSNTVDVTVANQQISVDTGFIVCNDRNYPLFIALLEELGVETIDTEMSFGVSCRRSGLEYCGSSLNNLFAQRRNLLNGSFHRMLFDIVRFNNLAEKLLDAPPSQSLAGFLGDHGFSGMVIDDYLVPMAAAIWSSNPSLILSFPAAYFGRFFHNHGLLSINNRPQWRTVAGGSRQYVDALIKPFRDSIRVGTSVSRVRRFPNQVRVTTADGHLDTFDAIVLACHSDQALSMLEEPTEAERQILGAIRYQANDTVLHTDRRLMPANTRAWAAWNYHRMEADGDEVSVTYDMTNLQHLPLENPLMVSLNATRHIDPDTILRQFTYEHPLYDLESVAARSSWAEINGQNNTFYCGAYWGYGFHEDGVRSAANAVEAINTRYMRENDSELHLQRVG
jgi:predicted NAD/FAD-binding protein